jgi:hypothetical protein
MRLSMISGWVKSMSKGCLRVGLWGYPEIEWERLLVMMFHSKRKAVLGHYIHCHSRWGSPEVKQRQ